MGSKDSLLAAPGEIGVGPTDALVLRVSAAALVRVTFAHPETGQVMLGLERKASLDPASPGTAVLAAQPFGGGVRILQPEVLFEQVGAFHYESPRSRDEQDFRILIRPADWSVVKQCCLGAFRGGQSGFLETDPGRELAEEFMDALQVALSPAQYRLNPVELLVENEPVPTTSPRALHMPTARIYTVYEAQLSDPALVECFVANSQDVSSQRLAELAMEDARRGGKGRANGALALPVDRLAKLYLDLPLERRSGPILMEGYRLEGNVPAVLREVPMPRYERFSL